MPRLIVDDAGQKKAFRVSQGRLSIGSAESAKLRLTAAGVEPEHAVLTVRPEGVQVEASHPVMIGSSSVDSGEVELPFGKILAVGEATITVEADQAEAKPMPAKPAAKAKSVAKQPAAAKASGGKPAAGKSARAGAAKGGAAKRSGARSGGRSGADREGGAGGRRRAGGAAAEKQGLPAWVPFVGVIAAIVLIVFVVSGLGSGSSANNAMVAASTAMGDGNLNLARQNMGGIKVAKLDADQKARYDELMAELNSRETFKSGASDRMAAIREFDEQVRRLVDNQFKTDPVEPHKIRLLWDRMEEWRGKFPMHNDPVWLEDPNWGELKGWMETQDAKYGSVVAKNAPYTLADAEFRAYYFLDGDKKRYHLVMPVLDAAIRGISDEMELELANGLRNRLVEEQRTYAAERLNSARTRYEEGDDLNAAASLITDMRTLTEADLIDRAAGLLVNFTRVRDILIGYQVNKPAIFEEIMQNSTVGSFVRANMADILEEQPAG